MSETPILKQMKEWHDSGVSMSTMLSLISRLWMPELTPKHREDRRRMKHNLWPKK